jgi:RNA polymerase sigma-70 factor (ECF subfamily)
MRDQSDGELMQLIANGNKGAFQEVYRRYSALVLGYGVRLLKDRATAEDISQDVWLRTVRLAASYRGEGSLQGWLLKITRNTALNHFRSRKAEPTPLTPDDAPSDIGRPEECEERLMKSFEIDRLVKLMQRLPDSQRVALVLWLSEKLSYDEIGMEMGLSEAAVKSLIFRARRFLEEAGDAA